MRGLSLVAASGGHSSSRCAGLSLSRPLLLRSTGSRRAGSVIVAHGPSCPAACGIFPDQGSNPCPLHWQADSQPLRPQGSPQIEVLNLSPKMSSKKHPQTFYMPGTLLFLHMWIFLQKTFVRFSKWHLTLAPLSPKKSTTRLKMTAINDT